MRRRQSRSAGRQHSQTWPLSPGSGKSLQTQLKTAKCAARRGAVL